MRISGIKSPTRAANLLISPSRVEAPFVMVKIGGFTFGVYEGKTKAVNDAGIVSAISEKYPNYVQSLNIKKINGTVNQYSLVIKYPITENNDPNFFEKIFSSVSSTTDR